MEEKQKNKVVKPIFTLKNIINIVLTKNLHKNVALIKFKDFKDMEGDKLVKDYSEGATQEEWILLFKKYKLID